MLVQFLILVLGLILLIKGADWMVNGASSLARKYNVSDLAIGLTIVAFGTSAPELVVNLYAAIQNHHDLVFGNVIGSNNINLFVILGIAGLITPMVVQSSTVWKEIPFSLLAAVLLFVLANNFSGNGVGSISRIDGLVLLALFAGFLFYVYKQLKNDAPTPSEAVQTMPPLKIWGLILVGMAGLVLGGRMVVTNAVTIASAIGISEKIVGLTIVALGTSLPELATSVVAALKKNNDIAVGNIIGSNIFNIFLILGTSALVKPISFNPIFNTDIYLLIGGTLLLFIAMFTGQKKKMDRWEAGLMLVIYLGYTAYLVGMEI
ncbi:calcium/sodium antiporter [Sunxiuqinia elliptica]|uniref:Cation:H+ antiporter n=1 Tax=Sunxiuqinia elliptica TaxID=655355 RepID=A0A1I2I3U6_9BACT|nr:calcium/sodium antiporter [Sunxiuqinia elliptica]SFF35586.1 cation:H+ antiporter [Sunxiuqinia elliptica]